MKCAVPGGFLRQLAMFFRIASDVVDQGRRGRPQFGLLARLGADLGDD
jgi:hypothetical protein